MEITEVRIKLMDDSSDRLQAFCSITFDHCFVIRDLKIIDGTSGPFVAMPSRKLAMHCSQCRCKNHIRAMFCNHCGLELKEEETVKTPEGRSKLYADIAHPTSTDPPAPHRFGNKNQSFPTQPENQGRFGAGIF